MSKIILRTIFIIFFLLFLFIFFLSTYGIETKRFNSTIEKKISTIEKKIILKLDKIKIKIDLTEFRLFLSTIKPDLKYEQTEIPIKNLKVYVKIPSLIKTEIDIEKVYINFDEIKIQKIKKIILRIKPSNIKTLLLNNVKSGVVQGIFDLDFAKNLKLKNYQIVGSTKDLKINVFNKIQLNDIKFQFTINKQISILDNIYGTINNVDIEKGEIKINNSKNIDISGSMITNLNLDQNQLKKIFSGNLKTDLLKNIIKVNAQLNNIFMISFDKKFKIKDFSYKIDGVSKKSNIIFTRSFESQFIDDQIKRLHFNDVKIIFIKKYKKENILKLDGKYKINEGDFKKFNLQNTSSKNVSKYNLTLKISEKINFELLNYFKKLNQDANLEINFLILKNKFNIKNLKLIENKNLISISDLVLDKKFNLIDFKEIIIKTYHDDIKNNDFKVSFGKKILIEGEIFDSSNIGKLLSNENKKNPLKNINKNISINFKNINTNLAKQIKNFNLLGTIEKGKFVKISSKGELDKNKYIDIKLYKNKKLNFLEIYSDEPQILLSEYKFFKGIEGGKLLYNMTYDDKSSISSILIEKFKIKDAPGIVKLLSLADFGGMADLVTGEGLSFDNLEIKLNKNEEILTLDELFAVGPSVSVLMNGYVENKSGLTSIRGTMVPAKELNKLIAKIPIIGDILIPKQIGEGLFGVSFKMKGLPGEIKTTADPIKTLTPRFIIRAIEKLKKPK